MGPSEEITHKGKVTQVNAEFTIVEIISESACSACRAKSLCSLSESEKKEIKVPSSPWKTYAPGDEVEVRMKASMGHKAVFVAYGIPLLVLLAVIAALSAAGVSELVAGLSSIAAVALYYLIIWLFRDKLRNEYYFSIK